MYFIVAALYVTVCTCHAVLAYC